MSFSKKVRKYLHRRGIEKGIPVVYSWEKPITQFEYKAEVVEELVTQRGRKRSTLGSVVYLPAIMGLWASSFILRKLSDKI
ncbi:MAG: hypothetical protein K9N07_04095 [Candidatus Cloacimonetes bacterium]|nr:hypothetical protein [Candidatus Cloacimonadota bacterium]